MSLIETKNDRKEYMKQYHQERQKNDPMYREMKNTKAKKYYKQKQKTDYELWYDDMVEKANFTWYNITLPKLYAEKERAMAN